MLFMFVVRVGVGRAIRRTPWDSAENQLRWSVKARNLTLVAVVLGIIVIWSTELRTLALSAVAIAAAIVIATKEVILCFSGSFYRASVEAFSIGDRIEVAGYRGDVIDMGFFSTTVLEVGAGNQRSGRAIAIPNSLFLSQSIINETFTDSYVLHIFTVPVRKDVDWVKAERFLLRAAREVARPFLEQGKAQMEALARQHNLSAASLEARVSVRLAEADKLELVVRILLPAREKWRHEQAILRRYIEALEAGKFAREEPLPTDVEDGDA